MNEEDINILAHNFCFPWSTMQETQEKWTKYYAEQQSHIRLVGVVTKRDQLIGYGSLLLDSNYPYFKEENIPEIHDIWIDKNSRRSGCGKKLITYLEDLARHAGYKYIGLGVGLYSDYGPAQKLYVQLQYVPDGNGVTYKDLPVTPGEKYPVDDELILWMEKAL